MNTRAVASAVLVATLGLGGCATNPIADTVSSLQVCTQSVRILTDMEAVIRLAVANPLGAATHTARLAELSDEFAALEPRDAELQAAHSALGLQITRVQDALENPSIGSVTAMPALVAETQTALVDFTRACTP